MPASIIEHIGMPAYRRIDASFRFASDMGDASSADDKWPYGQYLTSEPAMLSQHGGIEEPALARRSRSSCPFDRDGRQYRMPVKLITKRHIGIKSR